MKLAEAILERELLLKKVKLLEQRINVDLEQGRGTAHLQEEVQRKANQARDMGIAIAWTEQVSLVSGLPLGAYRFRAETFTRLAKILEPVNREKADLYLESADNDSKLIERFSWAIDLQVPKTREKEEEE